MDTQARKDYSSINISDNVDLDKIYEYSRHQTNIYKSVEGTWVCMDLKPQEAEYRKEGWEIYYDSSIIRKGCFRYGGVKNRDTDKVLSAYALPCSQGCLWPPCSN